MRHGMFVEISNLHFSIGDSLILDNVTLNVERGERLGIIGPNGSGKTTLFNCLSGFHLPKNGEIVFQGTRITKLPPYQRAMLGIGRVFQNFGIFKQMTVLENMITALESKQGALLNPWGKRAAQNKVLAMEHLESVGLEKKANDEAGSLSGGQLRLLEIARTLAFGAELFLMDEPTAGVSPKMKAEVERVLLKLQGLGKTVLIIEHDMNFIQRLCDRIIVLNVGRIVLDGSPDVVRSDALLQDIYFGTKNGEA